MPMVEKDVEQWPGAFYVVDVLALKQQAEIKIRSASSKPQHEA